MRILFVQPAPFEPQLGHLKKAEPELTLRQLRALTAVDQAA